MRRDKRQLLDQIAAMRAEGKGLTVIAEALGMSKGYIGWLCYEHDIPKARKKHLKLGLRTVVDSLSNNGGEIRPKES